MVKYSNNSPMPFTAERMTSASIDPPITEFELARGLLSPSELGNCIRTNTRLLIKGHVLNAGMSQNRIEELLSVLRPECVQNGDVQFKTSNDFAPGTAHSLILRKYGLSHFAIKGTRDRVTGIVVGSIVSLDNQDIHIKRYANVCVAIKTSVPHSRVQYETCFTNQLKCDLNLEKKLKEWMDEGHPEQPKREKE